MKLVRDGIPGMFPQHQYITAGPREWDILLRVKVAEEAGEVVGARTREELIEEAADLLEVLYALLKRSGVNPREVGEARLEKAGRLGAFRTGQVMIEYNLEGN